MAALSVSLLISAIPAACTSRTGDPDTPAEARRDNPFVSAIRDTGFECEDVVGSEALNADETAWRISCDNARAYAATLELGGEICVSPMLYVDGVFPSTAVIDARTGEQIDERNPAPGPPGDPTRRCAPSADAG